MTYSGLDQNKQVEILGAVARWRSATCFRKETHQVGFNSELTPVWLGMEALQPQDNWKLGKPAQFASGRVGATASQQR